MMMTNAILYHVYSFEMAYEYDIQRDIRTDKTAAAYTLVHSIASGASALRGKSDDVNIDYASYEHY